MIRYLRNSILNLLHEFGSIYLFSVEACHTFLKTRGNTRSIIDQIASISIRSLSTVIFAGIFVGAILVLQIELILSKYDARVFLGGLNTSTVVREVGPLIISFLLAGKIGAYTTAELGTMRVTEQIDAIECLGTNPIQYLVVPRFFGIVISSVILLMIGLMISICGSMSVASMICDMNPLEYLSSIPQFTSMWTLAGAMLKSVIYGSIVAAVACHKGYTATGGAIGVGRAVTRASLYTNLYILIANFLVSNSLTVLSELAQSYRGILP